MHTVTVDPTLAPNVPTLPPPEFRNVPLWPLWAARKAVWVRALPLLLPTKARPPAQRLRVRRTGVPVRKYQRQPKNVTIWPTAALGVSKPTSDVVRERTISRPAQPLVVVADSHRNVGRPMSDRVAPERSERVAACHGFDRWYHGTIAASPRRAQVVPQQPGRDATESPLTPPPPPDRLVAAARPLTRANPA
jgi:hypothetical protein